MTQCYHDQAQSRKIVTRYLTFIYFTRYSYLFYSEYGLSFGSSTLWHNVTTIRPNLEKLLCAIWHLYILRVTVTINGHLIVHSSHYFYLETICYITVSCHKFHASVPITCYSCFIRTRYHTGFYHPYRYCENYERNFFWDNC